MVEKSIERSEIRFLPCSGSQKTAPSPAFQAPSPSRGEGKAAFTLAEVLITLGIIGVVAAMTLPALVQNYKKQTIETSLAKFYTNINQAVKMAEVEYGDKKIWWENLTGAEIDEAGNVIEGSSKSQKWFNKYLAPHLKIVKQETLSDGTFIVYFPDGSALKQRYIDITRDWAFFPSNPKKCINKYSINTNLSTGICSFMFTFYPSNYWQNEWSYNYNKGFEPYKWSWDGTKEELYENCSAERTSGNTQEGYLCTALIQNNGWKIPDDYPVKF